MAYSEHIKANDYIIIGMCTVYNQIKLAQIILGSYLDNNLLSSYYVS